MTLEDRLARIEALLDGVSDISPNNPYEVALLEKRDELRHQLNKETR
jgi:capsule polysaccharide export protein KpsE/RkpR